MIEVGAGPGSHQVLGCQAHLCWTLRALALFSFSTQIYDIGRNLLIFSLKTKIEKMSKIILEQHRFIRSLPVRRQWKYKRKDLIVKPGFYFILFPYLEL
jgi:hypothetical protein